MCYADINGNKQPDQEAKSCAAPDKRWYSGSVYHAASDANGNGYSDGACEVYAPPADDPDGDGVLSSTDNCPLVANTDQLNTDGDAQGNACDTDDDNDGVLDTVDAYPLDSTRVGDTDGDGVDGFIDNCLSVANPDQRNTDGDAQGDACDTDDDNDGVLDVFDGAPLNANEVLDTDYDGIGNIVDLDDDNDAVPDASDNCPLRANSNQVDSNTNGRGDVCEPPGIAVGGLHACALTATGVQCWGWNSSGQLGDGTGTDQYTPAAVSGLSNGVAALAAGSYHTCALTTAGGVMCWGSNSYGQLGDGTTTGRYTPVAVSGLSSGVVALVAGGYHTCALTTAGGVKCWGANSNGALGDGTATNQYTPVAVNGLSSGVMALAAGGNNTCALTTAGGVMCWGDNSYGVLGYKNNNHIPVEISGLSGRVMALTVGSSYACALTITGGVECWGLNSSGQLGNGATGNSYVPLAVSGLSSGVMALSSSGSSTCALTDLGSVQCWGSNSSGQLGDGTTTGRYTPVAVSGLDSGIQAIVGSCALTTAGRLQCWGRNNYGQLGDGTTTDRLTPVFVLRDGDGDGVLDAVDVFPFNPSESLDTDHDGIGNNADQDDDGDGVPDYIDADPLNAAINTERSLSLGSAYKGSALNESAVRQ